MKRPLRLLHELSRSGGTNNEDACGCAGSVAWVIDGATGTGAPPLTNEPTDARWYAQTLTRHLARLAYEPRSLPELLGEAIESVRRAFVAEVGSLAGLEAQPCAGVVLVRLQPDETLDYAMLGDCDVLARDASGRVHHLHDARVEAFEEPIVTATLDLVRSGVMDPAERLRTLKPMLVHLREIINRPGGYYVARFEPEVVEHAITGTVASPRGPAVLLSDGFTRLVDTFATHSAEALYEQTTRGELESLYARLRQIEGEDPHGLKYARVKRHDDATCCVVG